MNVERMLELADFLHTVPKDDGCNVHPFAFNLGVYGAPLNKRAAVIAPQNDSVYPLCGTIGCIAGAACYLFGGPGLSHPRNWGPSSAADLLDLTDNLSGCQAGSGGGSRALDGRQPESGRGCRLDP